jgi:hypothetical protein
MRTSPTPELATLIVTGPPPVGIEPEVDAFEPPLPLPPQPATATAASIARQVSAGNLRWVMRGVP